VNAICGPKWETLAFRDGATSFSQHVLPALGSGHLMVTFKHWLASVGSFCVKPIQAQPTVTSASYLGRALANAARTTGGVPRSHGRGVIRDSVFNLTGRWPPPSQTGLAATDGEKTDLALPSAFSARLKLWTGVAAQDRTLSSAHLGRAGC
jgi:hypothetical protein